jgi:ComF family protein
MKQTAFSSLGRFATAIERLLFPPACLGCGELLDRDCPYPACSACRLSLQLSPAPCCARCGARFPELKSDEPFLEDCRLCRNLEILPAGAVCIGNYEGAMRRLLLTMKTRGQESLAIQFGRWLGLEWNRRYEVNGLHPQVITSVSVHWMRRLRRGYNVAGLVSEGVAKTVAGKASSMATLRTVRPTRKQGTLTTPQRFDNVRNCFAARSPERFRGKTILLVDDVMTSGATVVQATKTLLDSGAASVYLAIVARGVGGGR